MQYEKKILKTDFITVKIKIGKNGKQPVYDGMGGLRIFAAESSTIRPGQVKLIETEIAIELITNEKVDININQTQELSEKNIYMMNNPGTIDMDYRGTIKGILWNFDREKSVEFKKGDLIGILGFFKRNSVKFTRIEYKENSEKKN